LANDGRSAAEALREDWSAGTVARASAMLMACRDRRINALGRWYGSLIFDDYIIIVSNVKIILLQMLEVRILYHFVDCSNKDRVNIIKLASSSSTA
jgi:hypothetical protein